jgi:hypothetical protein
LERHNDPFRQLVSETLVVEEIDEAGKVTARHQTSWTLRWILRQEMAYLLELCGYDVVAQFSDFNGAPPGQGGEQIWVARRS